MIISLIAAMDENRLIGADNTLPWRLPADLRFFKRVTMGKPILMGRKTFESIGRPLPGRQNIVVTRDPDYAAPGCTVAHSVDAALAAAGAAEEIMLIGGASFYAQLLPRAQRMYLTLIHHAFSGDAWFPAFDLAEWRELSREDHRADAENAWDYSFVGYERK